jgi:hypothetical protein
VLVLAADSHVLTCLAGAVYNRQAERMKHVESKMRNNSVEENLKWFEALLQGKFCTVCVGSGLCHL